MNEWLEARNILAVRMDNIGDVIMLGPALRAIKETSPSARLTLLASPGGASAAPLLPWIDAVIDWRASWQDIGGRIPFAPQREQELVALLASHSFDAALIFTSFSQTPHVPGYVCYLAGIPLRAGESKEFAGNVLSTELKSAPDAMHQAERNLRLIERLGFVVRDRNLSVFISAAAREKASSLLAQQHINDRFIVIHPGASAKARRYPIERFAEVANLLMQRGWPVLVTAVERESELIATLQRLAPDAHYLFSAITLEEYAALIECASLVICNDTLPMHLADALRTPEVVLFSGTDQESAWEPRATAARLLRRSTPCYPCYLFECPIGLPCLAIAPEEVVTAAEELLASLSLASEREGTRL